MADGHILQITDDTFESEVLQSELPVLLDFGAEWCGPCKMIKPLLTELSNDYVGKAKIAYIDIDKNSNIPAKYRVHGIPTVIIFKDGTEVERRTGANPKAKYNSMLQNVL